MEKPVAPACLRNQAPIAAALEPLLSDRQRLLELGSGTGQHAVYCAQRMPHLSWQPTELAENLPGIQLWLDEAQLQNIHAPVNLDLRTADWALSGHYDAAFSANTVHFVSWDTVQAMFKGLTQWLTPGAVLAIYGPFNRDHSYTSDGNRQLDAWLKQRDPDSGIKDLDDVIACAAGYALDHRQTQSMPANNLLLSFSYQP